MIRFKVIKVEEKHIFVILGIVILLAILLAIFMISRSFSVKPAFSQTNRMTIESEQDRRIKKNNIENIFDTRSIEVVDTKILKKMMTLSLPVMDISSDKDAEVFTLSTIANNILYAVTNIDFFAPESMFCIEIPAAKLLQTEMTMTPGIEIIPEDEIWQDMPDTEEELYSDIEKIKKLDNKKPLVLIFHTHTTESYTPSKKFNYELKDKSYHTEDLNFTVVTVGEIFSSELNKLKVPTMHNKTVHDVPTYMTSYGNSLKTVRKILKENPSIKVVIDVHRDAPAKSVKKSREITTVNIDGSNYSRIMFVVGSDKTFPHPNWKENHRFCMLLHKKLEEKYPGISRGLNVRKERFNQHLSKKAILVEIGSQGNTMDESIKSAKLFARALAETLKEISTEDIN